MNFGILCDNPRGRCILVFHRSARQADHYHHYITLLYYLKVLQGWVLIPHIWFLCPHFLHYFHFTLKYRLRAVCNCSSCNTSVQHWLFSPETYMPFGTYSYYPGWVPLGSWVCKNHLTSGELTLIVGRFPIPITTVCVIWAPHLKDNYRHIHPRLHIQYPCMQAVNFVSIFFV